LARLCLVLASSWFLLCALLPSLNRRKLLCVSVVYCFCCRQVQHIARRAQPCSSLAEYVPRSSFLGTHPCFFLFLPPCSATVGPMISTGMGVMTLARLPFRLGLGRVVDTVVIFRPLRPICILVRTRILFCFIYDLDLCLYIWIF
jgi:hypothetical protein